MSKQLTTLEEANEWSAEKIQMAIGAKIFVASLLNLDRALANKNF